MSLIPPHPGEEADNYKFPHPSAPSISSVTPHPPPPISTSPPWTPPPTPPCSSCWGDYYMGLVLTVYVFPVSLLSKAHHHQLEDLPDNARPDVGH